MGQSFEGQQSQAARDHHSEPNVVKKPRTEPEFEPDNGSEGEEEPTDAEPRG